ncbi:hypothetical protein L226DRAFT_534123 [Lentinus tigrinus ALCF2SS1-7]|uniref:Uncharacterized protein n=1 Tax=Lentinus tigrinus ALCF2SS1-6 TaxID=1328759 RepID=A0A5C2SD31_9APHY|nr:hypothetical protein L227DRAFT_574176 [Lentinus tigrinus ALCF2SS1-6]RPD76065.1 hypothetical protein L226DRAFT_534123 [Lentinus tigrinus ALCF2SS1-7]
MLLSDLAEDVLRVIVAELLLLQNKGDLATLASTSRRLRDICAPILFSRCVTTYSGRRGIPPENIRPFVRHLSYLGRLVERFADSFGPELPHLPELCAVTLCGYHLGDIPWKALKRCLSHPSITSITFERTTSFIGIFPHPGHDLMSFPLQLTSFSYNPSIWRTLDNDPSRSVGSTFSDLADPYAIEYLSLSPLVLRICETVRSLTLPIEVVPLDRMVHLHWPQLRELCFTGQSPHQSVTSLLRDFLSTLPRLEALFIQLARKDSQGRLSILGPTPQHGGGGKPGVLFELRSLTLAYPDPNDAIFTVDSRSLTQLSLCDHPRYFYHIAIPDVSKHWSAPILSSSECLSLLRRMEMPRLHALGLVYETDGDDDELLRHISGSFPHLSHLELHRYRKNRKQVVPHAHIARILASTASLRTVNLNLDFHDEVRLYVDNNAETNRCKRIRDARGWELANIFEACPRLEYVALLTHSFDNYFWGQYHPRRCAEPRYTAQFITAPPFPQRPVIC